MRGKDSKGFNIIFFKQNKLFQCFRKEDFLKLILYKVIA